MDEFTAAWLAADQEKRKIAHHHDTEAPHPHSRPSGMPPLSDEEAARVHQMDEFIADWLGGERKKRISREYPTTNESSAHAPNVQ